LNSKGIDMAKDVNLRQRRLLAAARQAAKAAGKDWASLSKEERQSFRQNARQSATKKAGPMQQQARKAAQAAGKNWSELTVEERRQYIKQARGGS
jgi:hypothetical protein